MTAFFIINCGSGEIKSVGVAFEIFIWSCVNKKCHKLFNFCQIAKHNFYTHMTALFIIKFGSDRTKIVGGVAF